MAMVTRCTICGFVVDTRHAAEKPEGFGTAGRTKVAPPAPDVLEALRALLAVAEMTTFSDQFPRECEMARAAVADSDESPQPLPAPDHKRRIADYAANVERQRDLVRKTRGE